MKTTLFQYALLTCTLLGFGYSHADPMVLKKCGKIIAHELGELDFIQSKYCVHKSLSNTCPGQVSAIANYNEMDAKGDPKKTIRFLKLSLRTLQDQTWVVSHDDQVVFTDSTGKEQYITLSKIDSAQFDAYRKNPDFPVFRLADYVNVGKTTGSDFCWMLNTKTSPNEKLLAEMRQQAITESAMVEVTNNNDADWLDKYSGGGVYYSTRVSSQGDFDAVQNWLKQGKMVDMYMVEVDPNDNTKALVSEINQAKLISELDSMTYDPFHELFATACDIPLNKYHSTITMTSRPEQCINKNHHDNILD